MTILLATLALALQPPAETPPVSDAAETAVRATPDAARDPAEPPTDVAQTPETAAETPSEAEVAPTAVGARPVTAADAQATAVSGTRAPAEAPRSTASVATPADGDAPREAAPVTDTAVSADTPAAEKTPAKSKPDIVPKFTPGVQVFLRGESRCTLRCLSWGGRVSPEYNGVAGDVGRIRERVRLEGTVEWGPITGFAQLQDARTWGTEANTASNEANTDAHQGWVEFGGTKKDTDLSGWLRLGRQEINYGSQRLIGALDWLPNARSFDAIRWHGTASIFELDGFAAILAPTGTVSQISDPALPPDTMQSYGSQLAALKFGVDVHEAFKAELLALGLREGPTEGAILNDRRIGNYGLRAWGKPIDGLTYDAEFNFQYGVVNELRHVAWAWAANAGYSHPLETWTPGARLGYAMASGEPCTDTPANGCAGGSRTTEFFNFYPTNHIHYGLADLFGWRNMRDLQAGLDAAVPQSKFKLSLTYHYFQMQEPTGRWSNAGGANVGTGWDPTNTSRDLGHELDAFIVYKPWKPLFIQPGYGIFFPGAAGESLTQTRKPQNFVWLWLVARL